MGNFSEQVWRVSDERHHRLRGPHRTVSLCMVWAVGVHRSHTGPTYLVGCSNTQSTAGVRWNRQATSAAMASGPSFHGRDSLSASSGNASAQQWVAVDGGFAGVGWRLAFAELERDMIHERTMAGLPLHATRDGSADAPA